MNEIMNNILTRRSIRKFTDAPVSKEILDDLVQAALHAPSGCGKQTWKFTVSDQAVGRRDRDDLRPPRLQHVLPNGNHHAFEPP